MLVVGSSCRQATETMPLPDYPLLPDISAQHGLLPGSSEGRGGVLSSTCTQHSSFILLHNVLLSSPLFLLRSLSQIEHDP